MKFSTFIWSVVLGGVTAVVFSPDECAAQSATIRGTLERADHLMEDDTYFDEYYVFLRRGDRISIDMTSREIDCYLLILDDDRESIAEDDDGGRDTNATLTYEARRSGIYIVIANTYEQEFGDYRIDLEID